MSSAPSTFRKRDLTAAIIAAEAAGKEVVAVRVGRAGFEIITSRPGDKPREREENPWDAAVRE